MTEYTYKQVLGVAKACQANIKKEYKLGVTSKWSYFFAKAILQPNKVYNQFNYPAPQQPHGDYLSRQITMNDCLDCCKLLVKYVETNKRMPNYIAWKNFKISPALFTEVLSRVLIYLDTHKTLPKYANINSKVFNEETETVNEVYSYFVKVFGKITCIDDALEKISRKGYGYYYDDRYSNRQSIDRMKNRQGINCTDSTAVFYNIAQALGYTVRAVHVKCQGGDGHIRLQVKHKTRTNNQWINRDPAAVLDNGDITSVWCLNGTILSYDPQWFLENLNR